MATVETTTDLQINGQRQNVVPKVVVVQEPPGQESNEYVDSGYQTSRRSFFTFVLVMAFIAILFLILVLTGKATAKYYDFPDRKPILLNKGQVGGITALQVLFAGLGIFAGYKENMVMTITYGLLMLVFSTYYFGVTVNAIAGLFCIITIITAFVYACKVHQRKARPTVQVIIVQTTPTFQLQPTNQPQVQQTPTTMPVNNP